MIKLIASDIDGTLVEESSHQINPEYFKVIEDLKEVGIRFCACSGRQYASMLDLFKPIADDIFFSRLPTTFSSFPETEPYSAQRKGFFTTGFWTRRSFFPSSKRSAVSRALIL